MRSALRIVLSVAGVVVLAVSVTLALTWKKLQRAAAPTPRSIAVQLRAAALQLRAGGATGCPTAEQILELSEGPIRSELLKVTDGKDPWGTPFRVECDDERVRVFSVGPDKLAGTTDDIRPSQ